jgi:hypothetical protein
VEESHGVIFRSIYFHYPELVTVFASTRERVSMMEVRKKSEHRV